jgi:hypothetical protein
LLGFAIVGHSYVRLTLVFLAITPPHVIEWSGGQRYHCFRPVTAPTARKITGQVTVVI